MISKNLSTFVCLFMMLGSLAQTNDDPFKTFTIRGDEFLIDKNIIEAPAPGNQGTPAIAALEGTNYLTVWDDERISQNGSDIYGCMLNQAGVIIGPASFQIFSGAGDQGLPNVASNGTIYLVTWYDQSDYNIYGARVDQNGNVLDPGGFAISNSGAAGQNFMGLTSDGSHFFVTWVDARDGLTQDLYGARISSDGTVVDPDGILIYDSDMMPVMSSDVVFGGGNYMATYEIPDFGGQYKIHVSRISQDGTVLDPSGILVGGNGLDPKIGFDGTNFLVAWGALSGRDNNIKGTRISTSGVILDPSFIQISSASGDQSMNKIGYNGSYFFVLWSRSVITRADLDVFCTRVTSAGAVADPFGILISAYESNAYYPSITVNNTLCFIVCQDDRNGQENQDIYGYRLSSSGTVLEPNGILITKGIYANNFPAIAFDGYNYLAVWEDMREGLPKIYGSRIDQNGNILEPDGIAIATEDVSHHHPAVSFNGTNYLVVWEHAAGEYSQSIRAARVNTNGTVLDNTPFVIAETAGYRYGPSISSDGVKNFIIWMDSRDANYEIYGTAVLSDGTVLTPGGTNLTNSSTDQYYPDIAFGADNYLIAWEEEYGSKGLSAMRVTPEGTVLDPVPVKISEGTLKFNYSPDVSFDGSNFMVVWSFGLPLISLNIYGARISADGTLLDPEWIQITEGNHFCNHPSVAFDATRYIVSWDQHTGTESYDLYGAAVSSAGEILKQFPVCTGAGDQRYPWMAASPQGEVIEVYAGWTPEIEGQTVNTTRAWGVIITESFGIGENSNDHLSLLQKIYPNPSCGISDIRYQIPDIRYVTLEIYDTHGQMVRQLVDEKQLPGEHTVGIDCTDLESGLYFCRLSAGNQFDTRKLVIIR